MAANRALTDHELEQIRTLHAAGQGRNDIARTLNRSGAVISKACAELGLSFDRSAVQAATEARKADAAAKRALLQVDLLDDAQRLRAQLWQPATVFNFGGKDNTYEERTLDEPPFADKLKIMQAVGAAVDRSLRLAEHDADGGLEQAKSLLTDLGKALGLGIAAAGDAD
jgi:hypothetical protein